MTLRDRLAEVRAEIEADKPKPQWDPDLIPTEALENDAAGERPLDQLDTVLNGIDIIDAYRRWCGKSEVNPGGRTESIMISCPNPKHPDKIPSAWINTDKQVYNCGGCEDGGDKYTIAGYRFGLDPEKQFVELRTKMAEDLGYRVEKVGVSQTEYAVPTSESSQEDAQNGQIVTEIQPAEIASSSSPSEKNDSDATIITIVPEVDEDIIDPFGQIENERFAIDWRSLLPEGTFLREWMEEFSQDDIPEEYHFWLGLTAIGLAIGRDATLYDDKPPVAGNLFLCLFGRSARGKSRAFAGFNKVINRALPYDRDDEDNKGAFVMPMAASSEALIDQFSKPIRDEENKIIGSAPVRGMVYFSEMGTLMSVCNRAGNTLKHTLQDLYDGYGKLAITSRSHGTVEAENHFGSVLSTCQPGVLHTVLASTDTDSGFVNRWVFVMGQKKTPNSYGGTSIDYDKLADKLAEIRQWSCLYGKKDCSIAARADTKQKWDELFYDVIDPLKESEYDNNPLLLRLDLLMKKLILLFTADEKLDHPTPEIVDRAAALLPWIQTCYSFPANEIGNTDRLKIRDQFKELIPFLERKLGHSPSISEMKRALPRKFDFRLGSEVLKEMMVWGEVEEVVSTGKGRPTTRYHIAV